MVMKMKTKKKDPGQALILAFCGGMLLSSPSFARAGGVHGAMAFTAPDFEGYLKDAIAEDAHPEMSPEQQKKWVDRLTFEAIEYTWPGYTRGKGLHEFFSDARQYETFQRTLQSQVVHVSGLTEATGRIYFYFKMARTPVEYAHVKRALSCDSCETFWDLSARLRSGITTYPHLNGADRPLELE